MPNTDMYDVIARLDATMRIAVDRWSHRHPRHGTVLMRLRPTSGDLYIVTTTMRDGAMDFVETTGWPSPLED